MPDLKTLWTNVGVIFLMRGFDVLSGVLKTAACAVAGYFGIFDKESSIFLVSSRFCFPIFILSVPLGFSDSPLDFVLLKGRGSYCFEMSSDVFGPEDSSKVKGLLESVLGSQVYSHGKTSGWVEAIADGVLAALTMDGYKLVVDVLIMEKGESGFKSFSSARWNEKTDGVLLVRFENETIRATATIWALK